MDSEVSEYLSRFYDILFNMERGMTFAKLSDSISANFINQMIPHHMGAIEMSQNILKYSEDDAVRSIAENIITEQKKSIDDMRAAYDKCAELKSAPESLEAYQRRFWTIADTMFDQMHSAPRYNDVNKDFLSEMIPHHRGAIKMSLNLLRFEICSDLKPVVEAIIVSQDRGIRQMQTLLNSYLS